MNGAISVYPLPDCGFASPLEKLDRPISSQYFEAFKTISGPPLSPGDVPVYTEYYMIISCMNL